MFSTCSAVFGSGNRNRDPRKSFTLESRREHPCRTLLREPDNPRQNTRRRGCLEVQEIEPRMAACDIDHRRNRDPRIREPDIVSQLEQAEDPSLLLETRKLLEWSGQVATSTGHRGATRAVVPVTGGVEFDPASGPAEADEEFLDEQAVVEDDGSR